MEDIRTNFDKIMAKFNESVTHSAPKKLNFEKLNDYLNNSSSATPSKKRRLSQSMDDSHLNGAANTSNVSLNSSTQAPPSPWETRRLKADLIEAKARIASLKQEVDRQHKLHVEKETLSESRIVELKKQCDFSSNKIQDLERHVTTMRKRENAAKHESVRLQKELNQQKQQSDDIIHKLRKEKAEIEDTAREVQGSLTNELSEYRRHTEKIEMELDLVSEELSNARNQLSDLKTRAAAYDELKLSYDKGQHDLEYANSRIKELEFEIASYADWKEVTKTSQSRLLSLPELNKELERLRAQNKHLNSLLGNKMLLEEQVYDLKKRLEKEEGARTELVAAQVKLSHAENELKEWIKVAQDHCPPNTLVCPMALRARIEDLLQNDIINASDKTSNMSQTKCIESEMLDYKKKAEIYAKNIEDLNAVLKRHKFFKERLQRKLLLVSRERDCFKQLYENLDKDLTMSNTNVADISSNEAQMRMRVDVLEKALNGYKEMCANLEKQVHSEVDTSPQGESHEALKRELDTLRIENERLLRRKESLELELEHRCLKGDFKVGECKVVHFTNGVAAEAFQNADNKVEKLQAEIERLRRKVKKMEEDNEMTQARFNETTNMTMNIKEMNQLRNELDSAEAKMKKMKEAYKSASMEFREVCYMLFGYRVDRVASNAFYKLMSMYAESPDDYLNFHLNDSNSLELLETPYSESIKPLIESQLYGNGSLPVFLSALTLDLFQRSTITMT